MNTEGTPAYNLRSRPGQTPAPGNKSTKEVAIYDESTIRVTDTGAESTRLEITTQEVIESPISMVGHGETVGTTPLLSPCTDTERQIQDITSRKEMLEQSIIENRPTVYNYRNGQPLSVGTNFIPRTNLLNTNPELAEYSRILKQVFIDMNKIMLVHFEMAKGVTGLFVRALPVFSAPEHTSVPVNRCTVHSAESDPKRNAHAGGVCRCSQYDNVGHVIRAQSIDAQYCYDTRSGRHSVIVPVKQFQPGSQSFAIAYYFACKTSCPKGMQRRPINVVFTLETAFGIVLGRKIVGVRICTCPKRDKERMEKDVFKIQNVPKTQTTRKRKQNNNNIIINNTGVIAKSEGYLVSEEFGGELSALKRALLGFEKKMNELVIYGETL